MVRVISTANLGPAGIALNEDWADGIDWSGTREASNEEEVVADWERWLAKHKAKRGKAHPPRVIGKRLA